MKLSTWSKSRVAADSLWIGDKEDGPWGWGSMEQGPQECKDPFINVKGACSLLVGLLRQNEE